jgi:hypothetical protein
MRLALYLDVQRKHCISTAKTHLDGLQFLPVIATSHAQKHF